MPKASVMLIFFSKRIDRIFIMIEALPDMITARLNRAAQLFLRASQTLLNLFVDFVAVSAASLKDRSDILIVRLDAIGDFILWMDQAKEYVNFFQGKEITLIANESWVEIARMLPYWNRVIPINTSKFMSHPFYRLKKTAELRQVAYHMAVNPTRSRQFRFDDTVIRNCRAIHKIGSSSDRQPPSLEERVSSKWYTKLVSISPEVRNELDYNSRFLKIIGAKTGRAGKPSISVSNQLSLSSGVQIQFPYFVIFPGAGEKFRQWPADRFAFLAEQIHRKTNWQTVICGSLEENYLAKKISQKISIPVTDLTGKTTLTELFQIISDARLVVSNETSGVHIAACVDTPSLCIVGGGHFGRFVPYSVDNCAGSNCPTVVFHYLDCFGCNWTKPCLPADDFTTIPPCIGGITTEKVLSTLNKMLVSCHPNEPVSERKK